MSIGIDGTQVDFQAAIVGDSLTYMHSRGVITYRVFLGISVGIYGLFLRISLRIFLGNTANRYCQGILEVSDAIYYPDICKYPLDLSSVFSFKQIQVNGLELNKRLLNVIKQILIKNGEFLSLIYYCTKLKKQNIFITNKKQIKHFFKVYN